MKILIELWLRPFAQGIVGTTAALLGIGLASAAGSAASGILGSSAASKAAADQSQTALQVAQLQSQDANKALDFQKSQYNDAVTRMQPWLRTGSGATNILDRLLGMSPSFLNSATPSTPSQTPPNPSTVGEGGNGIPAGQGGINRTTAGGTNGGGSFGIVGDGPQPRGGIAAGQSPLLNRFAPLQDNTETRQNFEGLPAPNNPGTVGPSGVMSFGGGNLINGGIGPGTTPVATSNGSPGQVPRTDGGITGVKDPTGQTGGIGDGSSLGNATASNGDTSGLPDGFLSQIWDKQFQAPTTLDEQNDPGVQARLRLGADTLERSAAARGNLMTGGEAKNLDQFAQDYASNEYGNVYNRAANTFSTNYNIFKQNQNDIFNRYATLAGYGQTAAGELNNSGVATAGQVGNTLLTSGAQIGSNLNAAAAARGSGYVGSTNAITGAIGSGVNSTMDLLAMYQAMQKGSPVGAV